VNAVQSWAAKLGYDRFARSFVQSEIDCPANHPYAPEIRSVLWPTVDVLPAQAAFCIDNVPTIYMVDGHNLPDSKEERQSVIRQLCERLWNQNLARAVLVATDSQFEVWSVDNPKAEREIVVDDASASFAEWSAKGLLTGEVLRGRDHWFDPKHRVDKALLDNVSSLVEGLKALRLSPSLARELTANLIFVAYLEDRKIVSTEYRDSRGVRPIYELVSDEDVVGLNNLFHNLRADFNGNFLRTGSRQQFWTSSYPKRAFELLRDFLGNTVLRTGQKSFWRYDFGQIPIELIAGIYETFLASKADEKPRRTEQVNTKRSLGAYYTPRILADWVVDLAFDGRDVLKERIFDGACGSGMLLTAAFRRMIREHEAFARQRLTKSDFKSRCELLTTNIFGADIDEDACRLTAFSLYLALLEDLQPNDIETLRNGGHKLPNLDSNIRSGVAGDFFSLESDKLNRNQFTTFISNPPWREMSPTDRSSASVQKWRARQPAPVPNIAGNQIATAFALGAADTLQEKGRVVLILPVTPFLSAEKTKRAFRADLVGRYKINRIVNFSDMRRLIFTDAVHPFIVLEAEARSGEARYQSILDERFEYWTPKTDVALAFGRFIVHGTDQAELPTSALIDELSILQMRYWGSDQDLALLRKLWRHGRVNDLLDETRGWDAGKGFHLKDEDQRRPKAKWYKSAPDWIKSRKFLDAKKLPGDLPIVESRTLEKFPYTKIARELPKRFSQGYRVLWPDGTHPEAGVNAVFSDKPFTFRHSLGVISASSTEQDRLLARFLATYMRSPMAIWLSLILSNSVASERPKLHLAELRRWPFMRPEDHPAPNTAQSILEKVDALLDDVEQADEISRPHIYGKIKPSLDALVMEYFGLRNHERVLVEEMAAFVGPSIQPASLKHQALMKQLRTTPSHEQMMKYCHRIQRTLEDWRGATRGEGFVSVEPWSARTLPIGAAVLNFSAKNTSQDQPRFGDDSVVGSLLETLRHAALHSRRNLLTIPNITVVENQRITIIKPLTLRFWLERTAIEDANSIATEIRAVERMRMDA
jgi:hypothetical protein